MHGFSYKVQCLIQGFEFNSMDTHVYVCVCARERTRVCMRVLCVEPDALTTSLLKTEKLKLTVLIFTKIKSALYTF